MARRLRLLTFLAVLSAIALQCPVSRAQSAGPASAETAGSGASRESSSSPDTVVIQAHKDRETQRQITKFVSGGIVAYPDQSLERWNQPLCTLVSGLPDDASDFIRARVSQIARDAHVAVAPERCQPNVVIVISDDPDPLVHNWNRRFRGLFNTCHGMAPVRRFLESRAPVRVFYNARVATPHGPGLGSLVLDDLPVPPIHSSCLAVSSLGTYLHHGSVQELVSAVIVVDGKQATGIKLRQLADYLAMFALAQIRDKADLGTSPSILHLFDGSDPKPTGLTPWDEAFLQSLYTTDQSSVLEIPEIESRMFRQLAGH